MARMTINGIGIDYELLGDAGAPPAVITPGGRFPRDTPGVPELAAELVNQIHRAVRIRRQAPVGIRNPQVLVVQRVVDFPPETEILLLRQMEILGQRHVDVPEPRRAHSILAQAHVAKLPPLVEDARIGRVQKCGVRAKAGLEGRRIEPLILLILPAAATAECARIANQVDTAANGVAGPIDCQWNTILKIPVLREGPSTEQFLADSSSGKKLLPLAEG